MNTINKKLKVLSLFDGISCARVAIERAGFEIETYYASEIDKYAIQIAQKNFPNTIQIGSVVDLKGEDVKDIDILIGGSPCQDLSIAKKNREGLSGARSGLFYEYVRILKEVKPKYFILENVNSMPKEAKQMITAELFGIEPIMINAALVSAQNRKRLFWVGKLVGDKYEQVDIELPEDEGILLKDILEENVDEKYNVGKDFKLGNSQGNKCYPIDGKSATLMALGGGGGAKTGLYAVTKNYGKWKERLDGKSTCLDTRYASFPDNHGARTGICCISSNQKHATISEDKSTPLVSAMGMGGGHIPMVYGRGVKTGLYAIKSNYNNTLNYEKANTLGSNSQCQTAKTGQGLVDFEKHRIRKLTPIECERLQSLPDNYTEGVSNTQKYKGLGNAFNVDVVAHIIKSLSL